LAYAVSRMEKEGKVRLKGDSLNPTIYLQ